MSTASDTPHTSEPTTSLSAYVAKLRRHDWDHLWSDDFLVWKMGIEERRELDALQRQLDPDFSIWNEYAPIDFQRNH